jgi:hypothetical protein
MSDRIDDVLSIIAETLKEPTGFQIKVHEAVMKSLQKKKPEWYGGVLFDRLLVIEMHGYDPDTGKTKRSGIAGSGPCNAFMIGTDVIEVPNDTSWEDVSDSVESFLRKMVKHHDLEIVITAETFEDNSDEDHYYETEVVVGQITINISLKE